MKNSKKIFTILCAALCLLAAIGLMGCNLSVGEYEPLTPLTEEETIEIRQAYFDYFVALEQEAGRDTSDANVNQIKIIGYYGTYGEWKVLNMKNSLYGYPAVMEEIEIGGIYIGQFTAGRIFFAYDSTATDIKDSFVILERAYENGTITKADLRQIAYYARQGE